MRKKAPNFELYEPDAATVVRALKIAYEQTRRAATGNVRAPMIAEATDYAMMAKAITQKFPSLSSLIQE